MMSKVTIMERIAVVYAYHEQDTSYQQRLSFFLKKALPNHDHVDFVFVINGHVCSVKLLDEMASQPNVYVVRRDNDGYDFGAYYYGMKYLYEVLQKEYDYYFYVNSSAAGPFMPAYVKMSWLAPFLELFKENPNVRLVGSTINVDKSIVKDESDQHDRYLLPHVQTYAFMFDKLGMEYIKASGAWAKEYASKIDLIMSLEVGSSTLILTAPHEGWTINCLVSEYRNVDYRNLTHSFNMSCMERYGDPVYNLPLCFGRELHPYETIFLKGNRRLHYVDRLMAEECTSRLLVVIPGFGDPEWDRKVDVLYQNMAILEKPWVWSVDYVICQYTPETVRRLPDELRTRPNVRVIDCSKDDVPVLGNNLLKYVPPGYVESKGYTHVMLLLDDILLDKATVNLEDIKKLQEAAKLDVVSPALKKEGMSYWTYMATPHARDPRVNKDPILRIMNRCELFCYFMTPDAYQRYYGFIHPKNPWLWGMDMMLRTHMEFRVGIIHPMKMLHQPSSHDQDRQNARAKEMEEYFTMHSVTKDRLLLLPPDASHFYDGVCP